MLQFLRSGVFELAEPLTVEGALAEARFFLIEPLIDHLQAQERIAQENATERSSTVLRFTGCYVRHVPQDPAQTEAFQFIE
eukprot:856771-Prymnesium_polylepis.1